MSTSLGRRGPVDDRRPHQEDRRSAGGQRKKRSCRSDGCAAGAFRPVPYAPPKHVAIIMDGNGRWAKARAACRAPPATARAPRLCARTVEAAPELGIPYLTLFGFSSENWSRPAGEVFDLMGLLRLYLRSEIAELHKNGVRLRVIGDRARLSADIVTHDRERRGADPRQHRAQSDHRAELWQRAGNRRRRPSDGARGAGRAAAPEDDRPRKASPPACYTATSPIRTC